jgi:hypothetical protein
VNALQASINISPEEEEEREEGRSEIQRLSKAAMWQ